MKDILLLVAVECSHHYSSLIVSHLGVATIAHFYEHAMNNMSCTLLPSRWILSEKGHVLRSPNTREMEHRSLSETGTDRYLTLCFLVVSALLLLAWQ